MPFESYPQLTSTDILDVLLIKDDSASATKYVEMKNLFPNAKMDVYSSGNNTGFSIYNSASASKTANGWIDVWFNSVTPNTTASLTVFNTADTMAGMYTNPTSGTIGSFVQWTASSYAGIYSTSTESKLDVYWDNGAVVYFDSVLSSNSTNTSLNLTSGDGTNNQYFLKILYVDNIYDDSYVEYNGGSTYVRKTETMQSDAANRDIHLAWIADGVTTFSITSDLVSGHQENVILMHSMVNGSNQIYLDDSNALSYVNITTSSTNAGVEFKGPNNSTQVVIDANNTAAYLHIASSTGDSGYISMAETDTAPPANTNDARIYAQDNGSGKTRLMVKFGTGAAQQIAIEP